MKRLPRLLLLPILVMLMAGCASAPVAPGCTRIGHDGQFCLLPPSSLPSVSAMHLVTVQHDGRTDSFMGQLQVDSHALRLAGLSLFGTSLFALDYDGHAIHKQPEQINLHGELLISMLELALADPAALQPRLHNLTLTLAQNGTTQTRQLFEHGHLIARIEKTGDTLSEARINIAIPLAKLVVSMTPLGAAGGSP
ncbi:MAG TPA: DUF3261 domain-containing protein [Gammaproteobacteria bacterium]|nr:DUF3261 domain-containing protein [Gammaproteobacteria bacterium]